jgi:N-acyl-D-aspartate/D-glutamate deacylase
VPGADADLVFVDLEREHELRDEYTKTKVGWTPYHGWRVRGKPVLTMLRGTVVARDGEVTGAFGFGTYLEGRPLEFTAPQLGRSPGLSLRPRQARST